MALAPRPPRPAGRRTSAGSAGAPQRSGPSRASVAIGAELNNLATKLEGGNTFSSEYNFMSNSPFAVLDARGQASPLLAASLPSRDNGTWTVNPDGTMTTTWQIRPNAKWHDGRPIVVDDVVFAFRVATDDLIAVREREPERFMERIVAQDPKTFVISWKQPYPWANQLAQRQLEPLPEHIMGGVYAAGDRGLPQPSLLVECRVRRHRPVCHDELGARCPGRLPRLRRLLHGSAEAG